MTWSFLISGREATSAKQGKLQLFFIDSVSLAQHNIFAFNFTHFFQKNVK